MRLRALHSLVHSDQRIVAQGFQVIIALLNLTQPFWQNRADPPNDPSIGESGPSHVPVESVNSPFIRFRQDRAAHQARTQTPPRDCAAVSGRVAVLVTSWSGGRYDTRTADGGLTCR